MCLTVEVTLFFWNQYAMGSLSPMETFFLRSPFDMCTTFRAHRHKYLGLPSIQYVWYKCAVASKAFGLFENVIFKQTAEINDAACKLAREVANEGDAIVCGGLSPVMAYSQGKGEEAVRLEFRHQVDIFMEHEVDFVLAEVKFTLS